MIPYGRQSVDENDIRLVVETLRSDWLTTGPMVTQFENEFAEAVGASHAVAVSNGTAALHAAMETLELGEEDEVIVPAITFVATANAVLFCGANPVFADIVPETLLVCPNSVRKKITDKTKAIVAVDYAGQPCNYTALREIADEFKIPLIADACHSLGASQNSRAVGTLADLNCFSFHPVKPMTTGEGGMVTTHSKTDADRIRRFRSHGIDADFRQRSEQATHRYDMVELGFNYRLTDIQAALGVGQLRKLNHFTARRNQIADQYDRWLCDIPGAIPLMRDPESTHAFHLYPIRIHSSHTDRDQVFNSMRELGIGVNVHYRPVYMNSYYQRRGSQPIGSCPHAESAYEQILSLPVFVGMDDAEILQVVDSLRTCLENSSRHAA